RVLSLNAIDLSFLVGHPGSAARRSFEASVSGLVGVGEHGVLALTASFTGGAGATDYEFHGELLEGSGKGSGPDGADLEILEVLGQFLGRERHPDLPKLFVR